MSDLTARAQLLEMLTAYSQEALAEDAPTIQKLQAHIEHAEDCFGRPPIAGATHLCASVLPMRADTGKGLFGLHKKTGYWIQIGGHMDGMTDPIAVALKELEEETGLTNGQLVSRVPLDILAIGHGAEVFGYPKTIIDIRYLALLPAGTEPLHHDEFHDIRWLSPDEAMALANEQQNPGTQQLVAKWQRWLQQNADQFAAA